MRKQHGYSVAAQSKVSAGLISVIRKNVRLDFYFVLRITVWETGLLNDQLYTFRACVRVPV